MKKVNKNVIIVLASFFAMAALALEFDINHYSISYILFTFLFGYFLYHVDFKLEKRKKKYVFFLSFVSSLIIAIGSIFWRYEFEQVTNILTLKNVLEMIFFFMGNYVIISTLFTKLFGSVDKINIFQKDNYKISNKKIFIISFIVIFLCYIPYFLRCFPALMSADSFVQIREVETGVLTNFHPYLETKFFGAIYFLGKFIFGPGNMALAFYIIFQMLIMSFIFAFVINLLYKKKVNKYIIGIILLYFALSPLNAYYSVTLWKDVLFSVNFLFILLVLFNINEKGLNIKNGILYIIAILALLFFRNNGFIVFLLMIPFMFFLYKDKRIIFSTINIILLVFYFIMVGPVYDKLGVIKPTKIDFFSLPLQQVARVIALDKDIPDDLTKELDKFIDLDAFKTGYLPYLSDPIKNATDLKYLDDNKMDFISLWLKLLVKYPGVYVEAYLAQTLGYWYPDIVYHAISYPNSESELYNAYAYNIRSDSKLNSTFDKLIDLTAKKGIPFSYLIWSTGLYCYLLFVSLVLAIYNRKKIGKNIILYIPFVGLWISMMLGSPVFAELRYVYGIFVCMPLLILIPFMKEEKWKKLK